MTERHTLHVEGFSHANPIPAACRKGPLLMSGLINGTDPATGQLAETLEARLPSREEARLLSVNPAMPILAMTRVAYTEEKSAIEYVQSAYRGDRYKFNIVLRNL